MKILKQFLIVFAIYYLGYVIQSFFKIPIPSTIIGMILLFLLMFSKIIKPEDIDNLSDFFLGNLPFFFIPGGVGIIKSMNLIGDNWVGLIFVMLISTIITISITGITVQLLMRLSRKASKEK